MIVYRIAKLDSRILFQGKVIEQKWKHIENIKIILENQSQYY